MATKKTIKVLSIVDEVNRLNRVHTGTAGERSGWNQLCEWLLHDAEQYTGFDYLSLDKVPAGQLPGIILAAHPADNQFPDETRIQFFIKRA